MATLTKKRKAADSKFDATKVHTVGEATKVVKEITTTKFDASVDLAIRLGVDPRKANQMVRGTVTLPHGTGKTMRVLAIVTPDKEAEAKAAGADFVGLALRGSTPKRIARSTEASNLVVVISFTTLVASATECALFTSNLASATFLFLVNVAIFSLFVC